MVDSRRASFRIHVGFKKCLIEVKIILFKDGRVSSVVLGRGETPRIARVTIHRLQVPIRKWIRLPKKAAVNRPPKSG